MRQMVLYQNKIIENFDIDNYKDVFDKKLEEVILKVNKIHDKLSNKICKENFIINGIINNLKINIKMILMII